MGCYTINLNDMTKNSQEPYLFLIIVFSNVLICYVDLVVSQPKMNSIELFSPIDSIQKIINVR
jgi:hypothetical protein